MMFEAPFVKYLFIDMGFLHPVDESEKRMTFERILSTKYREVVFFILFLNSRYFELILFFFLAEIGHYFPAISDFPALAKSLQNDLKSQSNILDTFA